jgi:hypothetical protein
MKKSTCNLKFSVIVSKSMFFSLLFFLFSQKISSQPRFFEIIFRSETLFPTELF